MELFWHTNESKKSIYSIEQLASLCADMSDFLFLMLNIKIKPDFNKIKKSRYGTKNGPFTRQIHYTVDDEKIDEETFNIIKGIVNKPELRRNNVRWDIREEWEEVLYAHKLTDQKSIAQINHILRNL